MLATACATDPERIRPTYVSPERYSGLSCDALAREREHVTEELNRLVGEQHGAASRDRWATGVGVVLFWPALFALAGSDKEEEVASSMGELEAIKETQHREGC